MLGPHIIRPTPEALAWARRASIIKALDDPSPLTIARPDAITIFRAFADNVTQDRITPQEFLNLTVGRLQGFRPTYLEGLNEHKARSIYGLPEYIEWTKQYTTLAHAAGYKVAGFSFPTGNPDSDDWFLLRDHDFAGVDALSIHEYWGIEGFTPWNALRHRNVHEWLNGQHPPMLITECGMDAVEGAVAGWRNNNVSATDYAEQTINYAAEIAKDDYVLGATVFTAGPSDDWQHFSVDEIIYQLMEALADEPVGGTMPTFTLGFKDYADAHPDIGAAVSDLMYDANGTAVQYTETGRLEWCKQANKVYHFRADPN